MPAALPLNLSSLGLEASCVVIPMARGEQAV